MRQSIAERLATCSNRPSGFDYMRLVLATAIILAHSVGAMGGADAGAAILSGALRPFHAMRLGMFFGLSGFLVIASLQRCRTMVSFVGLRAIRLMPALAVFTIIAALILGPAFTTLPLRAYLASPVFRTYFLSIVGDMHFDLPGVFEDHPWTSVSGQLYTLTYELKCYLVAMVLAAIGAVRYRSAFAWLTAGVILGCALSELAAPVPGVGGTLSGRALVTCFLVGATAYLFRDRIILSRAAFAGAIVAAVAVLSVPGLDYLAIVPLGYITLFLGMQTPRRLWIVSSGDYSYGIYLYGFAVQQAVFPLSGPRWWLNFAIAYPIIVALAVCSWFLVEKPALGLRPALLALESRIMRWTGVVRRLRPWSHPSAGAALRRSPARETV